MLRFSPGSCGRITAIDGNQLTVDFEKAGEKRVLDSFVAKP
jgi:DNA helicase-2/ATP-dependent DNA helicase PcrA